MKIWIKRAAYESKLAVAAMAAGLMLAATPANAVVIVAEGFGGGNEALNGTSADMFDPAITNAGGSATWVASYPEFRNNGLVANNGNSRSAYLNLGSYIDGAKGTVNGKFDLTMTIGTTAGAWISLGFAMENPSTNKNFANVGLAGYSTTGLATIIYRSYSSNPANELDMFGGPINLNLIDGPEGNVGSRTLTVTLDLTPAGGYNGSGNYGTVTWSDSALGTLNNYTYTTAQNFGSILISESAGSSGVIDNLSLTQIPEPTGVFLLGFVGLGLVLRRCRGRS